jgi:hypothetical protein
LLRLFPVQHQHQHLLNQPWGLGLLPPPSLHLSRMLKDDIHPLA